MEYDAAGLIIIKPVAIEGEIRDEIKEITRDAAIAWLD
jgi:hypothetical protein